VSLGRAERKFSLFPQPPFLNHPSVVYLAGPSLELPPMGGAVYPGERFPGFETTQLSRVSRARIISHTYKAMSRAKSQKMPLCAVKRREPFFVEDPFL